MNKNNELINLNKMKGKRVGIQNQVSTLVMMKMNKT